MPLLSTAEADQLDVNSTESGVKNTLITNVNAITSRAIAATSRDNSADGEIRKEKSSCKRYKLISVWNRNTERNTEWG